MSLAHSCACSIGRRADEDAAPAGLLAVLDGAAVPGRLPRYSRGRLVVELEDCR